MGRMGKLFVLAVFALLFLVGCQQQEYIGFETFDAYIDDGNLTFQIVFPDMQAHSGTLELKLEGADYSRNIELSEDGFSEVAKCTPEFCGTYMMYEHTEPYSERGNVTATAYFVGDERYSGTIQVEVLG